MKVSNREELAWAAGFFDGEGSTFLVRYKKTRPGFRVQLAQHHDGELVYRFHQALGRIGVVYVSNLKSGSVRWTFIAHGEEALLALAQLWPYLGTTKRKQASKALAIWGVNRGESIQQQVESLQSV